MGPSDLPSNNLVTIQVCTTTTTTQSIEKDTNGAEVVKFVRSNEPFARNKTLMIQKTLDSLTY